MSFQPSPTPGSTTDSETTNDHSFDDIEVENDYIEEETEERAVETDPDQVNSTKRPTIRRPKTVKQKRDEEEFQLMKGLASSLSNRYKHAKQTKQDSAVDVFGSYVTKTLSELNQPMRNIAQFQINNILFQAQMGTLIPSQHQSHTHSCAPPTQQPMFSNEQQKLPAQSQWSSLLQTLPVSPGVNPQMQVDYRVDSQPMF